MIKKSSYLKLIIILLLSWLELLIIELSANGLPTIIKNYVSYTKTISIAASLLVILAINLCVSILWRKKQRIIGYSIILAIITLFSIMCYFVNLWHGIPFSLLEVKNAGTALSVLSGYIKDIFVFRMRYVQYAFLIGISIGLIVLYDKKCEETKSNLVVRLASPFIAIILVIIIFATGSVPIDAVAWNWGEAIKNYGYLSCFIAESIHEQKQIIKPANYDEKEVVAYIDTYTTGDANENNPDVIVILNETFYDLHQVLDIDYTEEPLSYIPNVENSLFGYAISPNQGGGTNCSEYELLTSNSLAGMTKGVTPFLSVDLSDANSIVSVMNDKGYETIGTHDCKPSNYNRGSGYRDLGFDKTYFFDDYQNLETWGKRNSDEAWTDLSQYKNLITWYEDETVNDKPVFAYCLTVQNHGDYNFNDYDDNIVHTKNDFGEYTSKIDEYSSCIYLSDKALEELFNYYSNVDRDVVIVMVGDHAPSFIKELADNYGKAMDADLFELKSRSVPYIIWSNHINLIDNRPQDTMGMIYLLPTMFEAADISMTGYYNYLVNMRNEYPIITKFGVYSDVNGNRYNYEDGDLPDILKTYFDIEYANLTNQKDNDFFKN